MEGPLAYQRSTALNLVALGFVGVFSLGFVVAVWWVALARWLQVGVTVLAVPGYALYVRNLWRNWDLRAELSDCVLQWSCRGQSGRVDLHDVAKLYLLDQRQYRFVLASGGSMDVDLRALFHAGDELDRAISEVVTARRVPEIVRALHRGETFEVGKMRLEAGGDDVRVATPSFKAAFRAVELRPGTVLLKVVNREKYAAYVVPRAEVPNLHALLFLHAALGKHSLSQLAAQLEEGAAERTPAGHG